MVTATRGERGEVIGPQLAHLEGDGPALAAHREGELAAALRALGVTDHVFLDRVDGSRRYEDSGMAWVATGRARAADAVPAGAFVAVPLDEAAGALARVLRARRPAVVVTYEPGGGYGHPDHVRTHDVVVRALELAAAHDDPGAPAHPVVLWAVSARTTWSRAVAALAGDRVSAALGAEVEHLAPPDAGAEPPSVVVPDPDVDLVVDVAPVRDRVLAALRAHATQVQAVRSVADEPAALGCYALSNDVLAAVAPVEGYRCASGRARVAAVPWPAGVRPVA